MSRKFGVELEVSGNALSMQQVAALITAAGVTCIVEHYNHARRGNWKIVPDGSLQNSGRNMMEIVSPPLKGSKGVAEVERVAAVLVANGITVNNACGMHVHVDAADLTVQHLKNVCKLVTIHEEHMKAVLPPSRRNTRWALWPSQIGLGDTIAARCARIDAVTTKHELLALWGNDRYRAINLESLGRHNTVEFRSHSGTVDARKIAAWIALCVGVVRNAAHDIDIGHKLPCGTVRQFTNLVRYAGKKHVGYFFERRESFKTRAA